MADVAGETWEGGTAEARKDKQRKKKKRRHDTFWDSIGRPRFVMAPMVDASELAFRLLGRRYGVDLAYTPMMHSRLFVDDPKYRAVHWQTLRSSSAATRQACSEDEQEEEKEESECARPPFVDGTGRETDEPVFVQFCGDSPETLLAAAQLVEDEVDAVDLNFGCPQGIARRGHYGAFLLHESELLIDIVSTLHKHLRTPVTCKMRKVSPRPTAALPRSTTALVLDEERRLQDTLRLCDAFEAAGCACLCIHGRTKEEKASLVGPCDWLAIRHAKERLSIPVIANGGVETYEDALRCLEFTGADAVMSAEGLLDNPLLFAPSRFAAPSVYALLSPSLFALSPLLSSSWRDHLRRRLSLPARRHLHLPHSLVPVGFSPSLLHRCLVMQEYLDLCMRYPPPHSSFIKSHLFRCLHPVLVDHEELRNSLGKACDFDEFSSIVNAATEQARQTAYSCSAPTPAANEGASRETDRRCGEAETGDTENRSRQKATWYRRHRTNLARALKREQEAKEVLIWGPSEDDAGGDVFSSLFLD
uniref:tRNA-dihydrouridine(16/17) synthase [NAD(P)(+)] n=1 Tax=Neospora caninum (strain Liverpool) TaxID=572307 RepID=A0A0F7UCS7_NEOCL|nr:TPA: dihydrouridine synthase domain-containing protein, putative [Neospora caninum Liverpool]